MAAMVSTGEPLSLGMALHLMRLSILERSMASRFQHCSAPWPKCNNMFGAPSAS